MTGIDQVLFGLSREGGIGPLAMSGSLDWDYARMWDARLRHYYRLAPVLADGRRVVPQQALSFHQFDDGPAALVSRFDNPDDPGRNNSHALVGPADTLRTFAPFLTRWSGWLAESGVERFQPIELGEWHTLRTAALTDVRAASDPLVRQTATLVRAVLADPHAYFAPITDDDPLPLLILLREVLDPVLSTRHAAYPWTFSTFEKTDTAQSAAPQLSGAPLFWCLRGTTYGETSRHRVNVTRGIEDDEWGALAFDLVDRYLLDPDGYPNAIRRALVGATNHRDCLARLAEPAATPRPADPPPPVERPVPPHTAPPGVPAVEPWALADIQGALTRLEGRLALMQTLFLATLGLLVVLSVVGLLI